MTVVARKNDTEELIVGLANLAMVANKLEELNVKSSEISQSVPLGLARIVLTDVKKAAKAVHDTVTANSAASQQVADHAEPGDPLGQVLWGLRGLLGAENAGFQPLMGRNRTVNRVHEVGKVWHGGDDDPDTASAEGSPLLTTRVAGPGRGVRVGVLDTKLFPHAWLAGGWAAQFSDTITDDSESSLLFPQGHATFVTGLVLSQAPGSTVQVRAALEEDGSGDSWTVAEAIVELGNSGLDVLNLSFLCFTEDNQPPLVLAAAVDRIAPDVVVVAAAGNHGNLTEDQDPTGLDRRRPSWPAALDDVIAVGASDRGGERAAFSPEAPWVDLLAPGVRLLSTYLPQATASPSRDPVEYGGFARWSGTSFAAALMSGAIAAGTDPGRVTSRQALQNILGSAQPGPPEYRGSGANPRPTTNPPSVNLRTF